MLVLARQRDQTVIIGDDIEVTVVDVRGDKVRLGINAPKHVSVHRKEVYEAIRKENREASRLRPGDVPQVGGPPAQPTMRLHREDEAGRGPAPAAGPPSPEAIASHRPFLQAAIEEARKGLSEGGLPIGSVLVRNGQIVGRGHNRRVQKGDPMAHAEIDALTNAGRQRPTATPYSTRP